MELKTKVNAGEGQQDITIIRDFDLPVDLVFKAHTEPEFLQQWMGTNVKKFEAKKHGSYQFETADPKGNIVFKANGTIHDLHQNQSLIRTFEMENAPFGVQLEFYEFEKLTDDTSRLNVHIIFKSPEQRDQMLRLPFRQGLNYAHNRLEEVFIKKT